MFILNLTKENLVYRAHGEILTLKPGLNLLTNCLSTANELKAHFGDLITFITDEVDEKEIIVEEPKEEKPAEEDKEEDKPAEEDKEEDKPAEEDKEEDKPAEEPKEDDKPAKPAKKQTKKSNKK